jgi:hypothetical protein
MKKLFILVLSLSLFCVACAHKTTPPNGQPTAGDTRALIVGKWEMNGSDGLIMNEYAADGTFILTAAGQTTKGTYKWLDDSTIETDVNGKSSTSKVSVSQDQLTDTSASGVYKFSRVGAAPQGAAVSATTAAQALIVGTWASMAGSQKITTQYNNDGSLVTTLGGQTTNGTYRWLDDNTIQLNGKSQAKIAISGDQLTMTIGSEVSTFKRETAASQGNAATATPAGTASITEAVLASGSTPLTHAPLNVTQTFPTTQGAIYAIVTVSNPPNGTALKGVFTAVDTNGSSPPNTKVGEVDVTTSEGTQNVAFHWTYPHLPAGKYKIDIDLNGTLDKTLDFSLTKEATAPPAAAPVSFGKCAPQASDAKPPGFAMSVTMAEREDAQGTPVNPGRTFQPNASQISAVLSLENVPAGTQLAMHWIGTDLGGVEACNTQIVRTYESAVPAGSSTPSFNITPPPGTTWPEGLYRVEIYVNGSPATRTDFAVCDGKCKFPLPWS